MSDFEKALNLLIHDLRAPLSVAHGYLRLIKDARLESVEERDRALMSAMDALGRISGLCTDASAFLDEPARPAEAVAPVPASSLIDALRAPLASMAIPVHVHESVERARIRAGREPGSLADALVAVIRAARAETGGRDGAVGLDVHVHGGELHVRFGSPDARAALARGTAVPFDAWRGGHGLALPLACRTIASAAGRIWRADRQRAAIGIALPVETAEP